MGEAAPYWVQYLLDRARCDADAARNRLRDCVLEELRSPDAELIVDEMGFLKKGAHSVGVKRQYGGPFREQLGGCVSLLCRREGCDVDRSRIVPSRRMGRPRRASPTKSTATTVNCSSGWSSGNWVMYWPLPRISLCIGPIAVSGAWIQLLRICRVWPGSTAPPARAVKASGFTTRLCFAVGSRMAGAAGCWFGAVSKTSPSPPTISFTCPPARLHWRCWCGWPDSAGRLSRPSRPPKDSAGWITTESEVGMAVIAISRWPCWRLQRWSFRALEEKNISDGQVPLSVPELRRLLAHLLWRGWHGVEHLLHRSRWRRQHQLRALICHYKKRGSPLPASYLQL